MEDKTLFDQPEVELDAEMAQRILDHGDTYSQQTADLAQFISIWEHDLKYPERVIKKIGRALAQRGWTGNQPLPIDNEGGDDFHPIE